MNTRILASLVVISAVGLVAGGATLAEFNDTESSTGNTFAAGEIDLQIDWLETYNGNQVQNQTPTDNPGPVFSFNDIKPGDYGEATISFHNEGNPYWLWMSTNMTEDADNGCTEPEAEVDDSCGDPGPMEGELAESINVQLWYDDYSNEAEDIERGDNVYQEEETIIYGGDVCKPGDSTGGNRDVALVLDESSSMSSSDIQNVKEGSSTLLGILGSNDQAAAVEFSSSASLLQELTTNKTKVNNSVYANLGDGGSTNMAAGIEEGHEELINGTNANNSNQKVLVLLSDGSPDSQSAAIAAADAAKPEVRIITIAYSAGSGAENFLENEIATTPDDAFVADEDDLNQVFTEVGGSIGCDESTLAGLNQQMEDGMLLDGDTGISGTNSFNGTTQYIGFKWNVSYDAVDNEIQTDSAKFNMSFYAGQWRHNSNPTNPFPLTN